MTAQELITQTATLDRTAAINALVPALKAMDDATLVETARVAHAAMKESAGNAAAADVRDNAFGFLSQRGIDVRSVIS